MTRAIGYVRVSTEEQALSGAGLDAQRAAIEAEAARRGWDLLWIAEDAGVSGSKPALDRPGLSEALAALDGKRADVLVVTKVDRLSRSLHDFTGTMARAAKTGWAIAALDLGVDMTTPSGEMLANVVGAVAQYERRLIGERTKAALAARKAAGVRLGRPVVLPDDVRRRVLAMRQEGRSLRAIAEDLNADRVPTAQGGARWHASSVKAVLASCEIDRVVAA